MHGRRGGTLRTDGSGLPVSGDVTVSFLPFFHTSGWHVLNTPFLHRGATIVFLDKLKQDSDWQIMSDSYDPLKLLKLIEKYILKQSDNQYKIGIVIEQLKLLLTYRQDDGVTNTAYYDRFKTRVDVAEHIGVSFDNPVLWDLKSQELYSMDFDSLADATKESKVKDDVKQAFLAYLFFINSNDKKHSQLKKTVANDHAKGDIAAYPSSFHAALTLMNDFKPLVIEGTAPVAAQGTAFAQKKGPGTGKTDPGAECNYNKEYFKDKECHNCGKKGHPARCCTQKKKASAGSGDDKSTSSSRIPEKTTTEMKTAWLPRQRRQLPLPSLSPSLATENQ